MAGRAGVEEHQGPKELKNESCFLYQRECPMRINCMKVEGRRREREKGLSRQWWFWETCWLSPYSQASSQDLGGYVFMYLQGAGGRGEPVGSMQAQQVS